MSLWTPDGERPVQPSRPADSSATPAGGPDGPAGRPRSLDEELAALSPEQRAEAEAMLAEMARVQAEVAAAPASDVIANHLMGFYELAAIHLSEQPPHFAEAAVAIDAMRLVIDGLGERLGQHAAELANALAQIQMAFVELKRQLDEPAT